MIVALEHARKVPDSARHRAATQSLDRILCDLADVVELLFADMVELPFVGGVLDAVTALFADVCSEPARGTMAATPV